MRPVQIVSIRYVRRFPIRKAKPRRAFADFLEEKTPLVVAKLVKCSLPMLTMLKKGARSPSVRLAVAIERASAGKVPLGSWNVERVRYR